MHYEGMCSSPFFPPTETEVCYPQKTFDEPDWAGMENNEILTSGSWEYLPNMLTARLAGSTSDLTLNFGTMLATIDSIIKLAHTSKSLDSLTTDDLGLSTYKGQTNPSCRTDKQQEPLIPWLD